MNLKREMQYKCRQSFKRCAKNGIKTKRPINHTANRQRAWNGEYLIINWRGHCLSNSTDGARRGPMHINILCSAYDVANIICKYISKIYIHTVLFSIYHTLFNKHNTPVPHTFFWLNYSSSFVKLVLVKSKSNIFHSRFIPFSSIEHGLYFSIQVL